MKDPIMLNRHVKLALFLSAAWLSQASANAGELTLFSGANLQGRELTLRADTRDLNAFGFNDRGSSMIVHSGRWEVCVDADFRNECRVFEPGEYRSLERMSNAISSAREIDGGRDDNRDERRGHGRRDQAPSLVLFDGADMRGRSFTLRTDTENLTPQGFNDRTQSMVVESGTWEVCEHHFFGGKCRVFGPGEYRNLDRPFHRGITSARLVDQDGGRGRGRRDDERGRRDDHPRRDGVELFADAGFGGDRVLVREDVTGLNHLNFNDRAGALIVYSGRWQFCQHGNYSGQCMTYGPGRYEHLGSLNDQISSIRRVR
jgi:hypothetical protein